MSSKELPVFRFYDRKSKRRRHELEKNVDHAVKKFKNEKLPQEFKHSITGPSTEWKTFFRQQDAFDYARQKTEDDLNVFAYESNTLGEEKGLRRYLVSTYPVFWHYYSQLSNTDKHHYEIIPEGAVCKLYFDLEFARDENPDRHGSAMVETLIKYVCLWLKLWFKVDCCRKDILDLTASTSKKFSRHLIFQLKDCAFKDNVHAGHFVHCIFSKLLERVHTFQPRGDNSRSNENSGTETANTAIKKETEEVIDRNDSGFESPLKKAQDIVKLESDDEVTRKKENVKLEKNIFEQFTEEELKSMLVLNKDQKQVLFCDMGVYTKNRNFRLLKSTKLGKDNPFELSPENTYRPKPVSNSRRGFDLFSDSLIANVRYTERLRILTFEGVTKRITSLPGQTRQPKDTDVNNTLEGFSRSPYPEIDAFIQRTVGGEGCGGNIRHWTYFPQGELLIYDIARYRWCHNVQRQHRSNNIMLCVDMKKGVFYQKCHDPDCKASNFKSHDTPLPPEVLPSYYFLSNKEFDSDFDDDDMVKAAEAAEETLHRVEEDSDEDLLSATLEMEKSVT